MWLLSLVIRTDWLGKYLVEKKAVVALHPSASDSSSSSSSRLMMMSMRYIVQVEEDPEFLGMTVSVAERDSAQEDRVSQSVNRSSVMVFMTFLSYTLPMYNGPQTYIHTSISSAHCSASYVDGQ